MLLLILAAVAFTSAAMTALVLSELRRRAIFDYPNERSSHHLPIPRGGGLGVVPIVLGAWLALAIFGQAPPGTVAVLLGASVLAGISWLDDLRQCSQLVRLAVQAIAVTLGLAVLAPDQLVFQGWLPLAVDRAVTALAWLWFINLFNFMDGIDGITGSELVCLGAGLALVALLAGAGVALAGPAVVLAGAGLGFLAWNWHPARIFLGDVGSVPLGYLAGWLLLSAAARGLWLPALILPLYYLADASLTLAIRLRRGERVWEAHREHFYQRAVRRGFSHAEVVRRVLLANGALIAAALASLALGALALLPAGLVVGVLLTHLAGGTRETRLRVGRATASAAESALHRSTPE